MVRTTSTTRTGHNSYRTRGIVEFGGGGRVGRAARVRRPRISLGTVGLVCACEWYPVHQVTAISYFASWSDSPEGSRGEGSDGNFFRNIERIRPVVARIRGPNVLVGMSRALAKWIARLGHLRGGLHDSHFLHSRCIRHAHKCTYTGRTQVELQVRVAHLRRALRPLSRRPSAAC